MSVVTLDSIREAADRKYGHTDIEIPDYGTARLLNALQLPKEKRKALSKATEEKDDGDDLASFQRIIHVVARSKADADAIIDSVGDNIAVMAQLFETYNKGTELGEA